MYIVSIFLFGLIGYFIGRKQERGPSRRADVILFIALILSFYIGGTFLGFGPIRVTVHALLVGILGGILAGRLSEGLFRSSYRGQEIV